jgi:hypothetical protein
VPSDFWLFGRIKTTLAGAKFDEPEQFLILALWYRTQLLFESPINTDLIGSFAFSDIAGLGGCV